MLLSLVLPWNARRALLEKQFGYSIHPTARIGFAWIMPEHLVMEAHSSIGTLTVCKNIAFLHLGEHAIVGRGNWITGFPLGPSPHFTSERDRRPELIVGAHSAITHRHLIDCTNRITIGKFTTVAGFQSQMLTHSIDLEQSRQVSAAIRIGDYCFIGTNAVFLGGSSVPDYCVIGAKSLVNKAFTEKYHLYGGVPARPVQALPSDYAYFRRGTGFVI